MSRIHFNLNLSDRLTGMVPPLRADGTYGDAALPPGMGVAGIYIIVNAAAAVTNRYIGISGNISHRFATRLAATTEMGFSADVMRNVGVCWGTVTTQDTPPPPVPVAGPMAPAPGIPAAPPMVFAAAAAAPAPILTYGLGAGPPFFAGAPAPAPVLRIPAPPAAFAANVDGVNINFERLLIRFCLHKAGWGGTVSNNAMSRTPYQNVSPNNVHVRVSWGGMGGLTPPAEWDTIWQTGERW